MPKIVKSLREEHAENTRKTILKAAIKAFASEGFRASSLDQIAEDARVTKGAVYHHFKNKRALFREAYREIAKRVAKRIDKKVELVDDIILQLHTGILTFLDSTDDPEVRQIMFVEAQGVLHTECRSIDEEYFLGMLRTQLEKAKQNCLLDAKVNSEILASLILGLLIEAALMLGRAENIEVTKSIVKDLVPRMLVGLLSSAKQS